MSKSSLRTIVIGLTLITALIHLVVLNIGIYQDQGQIDILFTLNGIGFLVLLLAFLDKIPFLRGKESLIHYSLIGYSLITIIAFFALSGSGMLGYLTKLDELLLSIATYMHLQKSN